MSDRKSSAPDRLKQYTPTVYTKQAECIFEDSRMKSAADRLFASAVQSLSGIMHGIAQSPNSRVFAILHTEKEHEDAGDDYAYQELRPGLSMLLSAYVVLTIIQSESQPASEMYNNGMLVTEMKLVHEGYMVDGAILVFVHRSGFGRMIAFALVDGTSVVSFDDGCWFHIEDAYRYEVADIGGIPSDAVKVEARRVQVGTAPSPENSMSAVLKVGAAAVCEMEES